MTILTSVMQFAMLPLQGLGQGAQPIISYNYGAKNASRVKDAFKLLLKVSLTYSVLLWLCIMCFPQVFASIFTPDTALIEFTKVALRYYLAVMFLFGVQISCQMTFNALGNAPASIIVAIMRKFVLLIPLIFIMPHIYTSDKTMAVYMAEPIADRRRCRPGCSYGRLPWCWDARCRWPQCCASLQPYLHRHPVLLPVQKGTTGD